MHPFRLLVSILALALAAGGAGAGTRAAGPNVILILADDLGWGDLGSYGQQEIQTPHLDRLAAEGMRFTQFYAGSSVCAPSRSCLMTGRHNGRGRVRDNVPHGVHLLAGDRVIPEVLREAGYRTGGFGKWSLGDHGEAGAPWLKGFDEYYGYPNQDHAHFYYPHFLWDTNRVVLLPGNRPGVPAARREYAPDLLLTRAVRFLEETRKDRRPFFLYFPTILPHWSEFPKDSPDSHPVPEDAPYSERPWPQVERNYAAMVTRLDRDVGRLLAKLGELGLERDTLVLFTSDNGPSGETIHRPDFFRSAGPFRGSKRHLHEGGIRVPLLARWPAVIAPGQVSRVLAGHWDILPTLAELAGAPPGGDIDGISLASVFRGRPRPREHEFLYWDYGHTRDAFLQAVRAGDWKAVRTALNRPTELYDLAADPGESRDLARERPEIVARLEGLMRQAFEPSPDYPLKSAADRPRE
jgi:arylsulfatase A-like enzyme